MPNLTRKQLADALNAKGIHNDYELLIAFGHQGFDVGVSYQGVDHSRVSHPARAQVWRPKHKTDPKTPWYNYGKKTFLGTRDESLPLALAWAEKQFGVSEWASSPFCAPASNRLPAYVLAAARQAVAEETP